MDDFVSYGISLEYRVIRVEKTYAWIIEIADSNIVNIIFTGNVNNMEFKSSKFPKSVINKCPAIIFAVKRTERDTGRIIFPVVSIIIIIGIIR